MQNIVVKSVYSELAIGVAICYSLSYNDNFIMQLTIQNKAKYLHVVANNFTSDLNTSDVTVKIHNYTLSHLRASFVLSTLRHHVGVSGKMSLLVSSGLHGSSSFQGLYSSYPQNKG